MRLAGQRIEFPGLQATITDVLVRIQMLDGTQSTTLIHPSRPWVVMSTARSQTQMALAYLAFGVQHILFGFDHCSSCLGCCSWFEGSGPLIKTITAFTVAHSITLALATLGVVHLPPPPIEAIVALSIVFLASELLKQQRGIVGLAQQHPWVIAFAFGLLHGFGFAGTLTRTRHSRPATFRWRSSCSISGWSSGSWALSPSSCCWALPASPRAPLAPLDAARPRYAIGALAAFWFIQRVSGFC